jgi:tRNA modification GTPase
MSNRLRDTIAAVATPQGAGGIAIIKISGPKAREILSRIFRPRRDAAIGLTEFDHQRLTYGHIVHPQDGVLDEVLVAVMCSPKTYTTEDVVEINCHGGAVVTQDVLDLVIEQGVRPAEPGEFTRRAFLGGRINLTEAEAVIDLINAKTRKAARAGLQRLNNGIADQITHLQNLLMDILAEIEAYIDFDDDLEESLSITPLQKKMASDILPEINALINSYREGRILKDGLRLVIAGRPNVGKSSLVNRFLNQERVIVTAVPGTTRDIIEEMVDIEGLPVVITDTAGIHHRPDPVEAIGIEKSEVAIANADLVLFMVDASKPLSPEDRKIYGQIKRQDHLVVQNKIDLCNGRTALPNLEGLCSEWTVRVSALTGEGLERLKMKIVGRLGLGVDPDGGSIVVNLRQRKLLEAARQHVDQACRHIGLTGEAELVAIEIKDALGAFQEILGHGVTPDVLDHIFKRFCIGK